ncbi:LOW QUALITY PROTEIN: Hypothetical protein PHPALM_15985, partial [Phytophthora palmivora]
MTQFAKSVGDVVPVRVRKQKTVDGVVKLHYSEADYTLLPAYFTWNQLYTEMHNYVEEIRLRVREPQPSTFRQLLTKQYPMIRIRSPRNNVCNKCSILYARMKSGVTADLTEELGRHTEAALSWTTNLALPSVASTPSQWYFLSLRSVNVFGIYFVNKGIQYNYVYDETVAGKGTDEVNSMLHHFIDHIVITNGYRKLTVYADNCGGQNKNNFVVKNVVGSHTHGGFGHRHTKNAVDRGFGHMRKHLARLDVWTMDQLCGEVDVKDLAVENPGKIRLDVIGKGPNTTTVNQDLRHKYDGILTDSTRVHVLFTSDLKPLP